MAKVVPQYNVQFPQEGRSKCADVLVKRVMSGGTEFLHIIQDGDTISIPIDDESRASLANVIRAA